MWRPTPQQGFRTPLEKIRSCHIAHVNHSEPLSTQEWEELATRMQEGVLKKWSLPTWRPFACNQTRRLHIDEADEEARHSKLAAAFIVRDGEPYLLRNVQAILRLGKAFGRFNVFYVENDSRDATRSILATLTAQYPRVVHGEMLTNISNSTSVGMCDNPVQFRNCHARIGLLARLRQRVFDMALARGGWDGLVMLDMDFLHFSIPEFIQMFALGKRLNATAIFGQSMYRNNNGNCGAYDVNAWHSGSSPGDTRLLFRAVSRHNCFGMVRSGHGGFPLLYESAIRAAEPLPRYEAQTTQFHNDLVPFNLGLR